jgi:putative addiction module component (TIGR02574 family)
MKKRFSIAEISGLNVAERIQLVEDLWDSIAELPEQVELPDSAKKELDKRIEAYHKHPELGSPWKEVKQRIFAGK